MLEKLPEWLRAFDYNRYQSNNYIVVDFETTNIDKGDPYNKDNSIVCSSYKCGKEHPAYDGKAHVIIGNEYEQNKLVELIKQADFWVAHNSKFEYGWLVRCGLPLNSTLAFCTQIAEYVMLSNRAGGKNRINLDSCLRRRKIPSKDKLGSSLLKNNVCPSTWPRSWLVRYSKQDVVATDKLFLHQRKNIIKQGLMPDVFTRNIFTPPIVAIESVGMHLDKERTLKVEESYRKRLEELQVQIDAITGGANPNSPKQMREVLYEKLKFPIPKNKKYLSPAGEPTTSFDYIGTLKPRNKTQRAFIKIKREYSKVNAALTKSLTKFRHCVEETEDHILTASLNQTITKTQRLSSSGKNYRAQFQNFPRIFKPLFSARNEGWEIVESDQGQLEYRVAVFLGNDESGRYDIEHKVDAHAFTAEHIFGEEFTKLGKKDSRYKELRTDAKSRTFKPLYGGESGTKEEVRYYKAFKKKHKGITKIQNTWKSEAVRSGKVTTVTGTKFYFPGTRIMEDGYITNSTNICNYPVQFLATANIVPIGVTYQWYLMESEEMDSFLINTIHDSSLGEVPPYEMNQYKEIAEYAFVDITYQYLQEVYGIDFDVPLEVEIEHSNNWADNEHWRNYYLTN